MASQQLFKEMFNQEFSRLIKMGVEKNQAAAQSLTTTQRHFKQIPEGVGGTLQPQREDIRSPPAKVTVIEKQLEKLRTFDRETFSIMIGDANKSKDFKPVIRTIGSIFSSSESVNGSFCIILNNSSLGLMTAEKDIAQPVRCENSHEIDIDIDAVTESFSLIAAAGNEDVTNSLTVALGFLTNTMELSASRYNEPSSLKQFLVVLEHPAALDPSHEDLLKKLLTAINNLPKPSKQVLCQWIRRGAGESRFRRYIAIFRSFMTLQIYQGEVDVWGRRAVRALGLLFDCLSSFPNVKISEFYNDALEDVLRGQESRFEEYRKWMKETHLAGSPRQRQSAGGGGGSGGGGDRKRAFVECDHKSFISYPFVLSPLTKASVLELDAQVQMRHGQDLERRTAIITGQHIYVPFFILNVSRGEVVRDTLTQVELFEDTEFKKPLKVIFDGEDGVDAGGVRKEFYQIMTRQLFDPAYGMFKYYEESRLLWFNSDSLETGKEFELIGLLLGVAIYNSIIIDLRMPIAVYKKLKGQEPSDLGDLEPLQPVLVAGLRRMLEFDGNVEETFGATFQLSHEVFGEKRTVDLKPNGGETAVTNENRAEYVRLYVSYILNESVAQQFRAFERGFRKVCGGNALDLFEPQELELLICGNQLLDFVDLRRGTRYDDGFTGSSVSVRRFWEILDEFDDPTKRTFLKFLTGSDRSPIGGLSELGVVISRNGSDDTRLPSAHTCFNHLLLPAYSSKEIMKAKLLYAMSEAEGFGLR